ncbi:hemagglutinin repeat-containing protein [Pseudomonas sp. CCOS 191]|uniref:hemagglutinin repeat-containing protein n=3 Tax=Pseudomonas TaxID=286 RepID=UPI0018E6BBF5|nr:hemagglutinin repeat-containing protein [Pseudomonas sp. CCOS 191]MBI6954545.1 hemagglutinin repeat-containing protein [Pseudomonas sp. CCOS 191]
MDVRLFAFLARQRSAKIQPREQFCGLPKRGLALLLANVMFWQPLWAQAAEGVVVSGPGTRLDQAGNGVPIINIAAPNGSGLSHNQFSDYNVGQQGLILNNATDRTQATQLGGIILGNPNLQGTAASVILNEVNGANASQLHGYTEVAGRGAHVIVANPHGITCDGCGFINTPQATLSTGKPVLENGQLSRYQVDQGHIAIEGAGLNASNVDSFELIARSTKINAEIQARNLAIVAGRNDVDARTLAATARQDDGSAKPSLAIDSSALGGMYAGAVRLVGTEAGVGVRLDGRMIASGGDIQLEANGQLRMAQASATGDVRLQAAAIDAQGPVHAGQQLQLDSRGELVNRQGLTAGGQVQLNAGGQLSNLGGIQAGINADGERVADADLKISAGAVDNRNQRLIASGDLTVSTGSRLDNQGGSLSAGRDLSVNAATLDNRQQGKVLADGRMTLTGGQLLNGDRGQITSQGALNATWAHLDNQAGELSSLDTLALNLGSLDNRTGKVLANRGITVTSQGLVDNRTGRIASQATLDLTAQALNNGQGGHISGNQAVSVNVGRLDQQGGHLSSVTALTLDLNHGRLDNRDGKIAANQLHLRQIADIDNQRGEIFGKGAFTLAGRSLDNTGGKFYSEQALTVRLDQLLDNLDGLVSADGLDIRALTLNNQGGVITSKSGLALVTGAGIDNRHGEISSADLGQVTAGSLDNREGTVTGGALELAIAQAVDNRQGVLAADKALKVSAASLDNCEQGKLLSDGTLTAKVSGLLDNQVKGLVNGVGATHIDAGQLDNRGGRLVGKDLLTLQGQRWDNRGGKIEADGALTLTIDHLDNRDQGLVSGQAGARYSGSELLNQLGIFGAKGNLDLVAAHLDNSGGSLTSGGDLDGQVTRLEQLGGKLSADGKLTLKGSTLVNRQGAVVGAGQGMHLTVDSVDNRGGELSAAKALSLTGQRLDNTGGQVLADTDLALTVAEVINQAQGLLRGKGQLTLDGQTLDNRDGRVSAEQGARLRLSQALDNGKGLLTSEGDLDIAAASLDNSDAELSSAGKLTLATTGKVDNQRGSITADGALDLRSASLDNRAGEVGAQGAMDIATGTLDNRDSGHVVGNDRLTLKAGQVNNAGSDSRIDSDGAMHLTASGFDQQAGRMLSKASITLDLGQGALVNHGLIKAPVLVLKNLGSVDNQNGEITSPQGFTLVADSLDNRQGKLLSDQALTVRIAQALDNTKGLVSAKGLDLHAASLDNREGTVSSRAGLVLTVDGRLDNRQGTLVGDTALNLVAGTLDNSKGKVSGKGQGEVQADTLLNNAGSLISLEQLRIKGGELDNREAGLLGSNGALTLEVDRIDNRGGEITGKASVAVIGTSLDNSDGGLLVAGTGMTLALQALLNRNKARLEAQTGLTLTGLTLDNDGGRLTSQRDMTLSLTGAALNRLGLLSAEGQLVLAAHSLDNSTGKLDSAGSLKLTTGGALLNQGGELLSDSDITLASASLDNTDKGALASKGQLTLSTGHLDNSRQGSISSNRTLDVHAGQLDNRDGGRVGSREALTATVTGLDQQGGKLFSDTSVKLDLGHGHLDNRGGLINAPSLQLDNLKTVANQGGELSSAQAFTVAAEQLDNGNGRLLSDQRLLLRVSQRLDNLKGLIGAQSLEIHAGTLSNRDGGRIEAKDALALTSKGLDNHAGKLLGSSLALDLGGADLDNGAGLITTAGPLTLVNLAKLDNQGGEISTALALQLDVSELDNRDGKLISEQTLGITSGAIDNRNGLVSGWQGLTVTGQSLDNRQQGTLSSRSGAVHATVTGALRNSDGGALVAQQSLDVKAASLDNSAKGILSSGSGQQLTITAALDNHDGGLIDAGEKLVISSGSFDNHGGRVATRQDLGLTAASLNNNDGSLAAQGALTLDLLGELLNRQGKLFAGKDLLIQRAGLVDNQAGQIASQGLLKVLAASVDNSQRGTLAANGPLTLDSRGALNNSGDGLIYSQQGDVGLLAASLNNAKGTVQAKGAITAQASGLLDNQGGKLIAQDGALTVTADTLDNRGGILASLKQALGVRTTGVLRNGSDATGQRGILQALSLDVQSASLDNHGGRIAALGGDTAIRTGQLDNRDGGISASGLLKVTGASLLNGGDARGEMVGQRIDLGLSGALDNRGGIIESASTLAITAATLDNQGGQLRAVGTSGKSQFAIGGLFDNRNGQVEIGNSDLTLGAGLLQNVGGKVLHVGKGVFDIDTANLTRAGGSLSTRGGLTLTADSWTNGSAIQAGRLTVNVNNLTQTAGGQLLAFDSLVGNGGNWSNEGLIASDGALSLNLGGTYSSANGRVNSLGTLGVSAAQMNLGSNASITGVGNTTINVAGLLTNQGRLSSAGDLLVNAGSVNNLGTLGGNQLVRVTTGSLRNDHSLLFSGGDMQLYTGALTNFYGDVYSLGGLTVAGNAAGGLANKVENISGSLESAGDMRLNAQAIENRKEVFKTTGTPKWSSIGMRQTGPGAGHMVLEEYYERKVEIDSPAGAIRAGRDLFVLGGRLENSASVITAQRDITVNVQNFLNKGEALGTYSELKSFYLTGVDKVKYAMPYFAAVMRYNAANDPEYKRDTSNGGRNVVGTMRMWDANWNESRITPYTRLGGTANYNTIAVIGWKSWFDGFSIGSLNIAPAYNPDVRAPLPAQIQGVTFFDPRTIVHDTQVGAANAVVQAGGRVSINATRDVINSVIQEGLTVGGPAAKAFDPKLPSAAGSTVINIHAQLPPDLAQQQVNPLALGGFTLPSGQNGLFRLSGQGGSGAGGTAPSWTLGSAEVLTQGRQVSTPGAQPGALQAVDASAGNQSHQQIDRIAHQGGAVGGNASTIGVYAPNGAPVDVNRATRHPGADAREPSVNGNLGISARPDIAGVTRMPDSQYTSKPHKYLIETNPVLTDLKQFMSSDYLLGNLGYDPDQSWKRLGDGLYEQRLIQQAVVARTGQQFIDGQTSGDQLFKYLMDNAIRSKDQLQLSLGVGLTASQVAALTHDIVWMEKHQVNGEEVLVPVLYLAQANNRLAPNGALIAGQDVQLIAGENLTNVGTLQASRNLSATAGNNLVNTGLIQAGERLELLAGNNLSNSAGGIITGRDVSLTAVNGDILNQRDQVRAVTHFGGTSQHKDYLDNAARIEAGNSLSLKAGQDINNLASVIQSGGDLSLNAGRDVSVLSVEEREGFYSNRQRNNTVQQHGATVTAGRDLSIGAGRDLTAVASQIDAGRNLSLAAGEDLNLTSAANEAHSFSRSKKVTQSKDQVTQVSTTVKAGGDVSLSAGQDMAIVASQVKGKGDVDIDVERDLTIASDQNESASYYLKKSKGSFGRKSSNQKESYHSTNVASVIEAGGDLTVNVSKQDYGGISLDGGRDVTVIGSQLKAGGDLMIGATRDVAVLSGVEEHGEFSKKTKSGFLGLSKSGKSQLQTRATQVGSELDAGNDIVLAAGSDVRLRASKANAGNDVELRAGLVDDEGDVNLVSANDTAYSRSEEYKQKLKLSLSVKDMLSPTALMLPGVQNVSIPSVSIASAKTSGHEARSSTSVGSQVVAVRDATLEAERDINVLGSGINAGRNVSLNAGRDVNITAAQNQRDDTQWSKSSSVGLHSDTDDNGTNFFAGVEKEKAKDRLREQLAAGSRIQAGKDLDINAGRDINQTGSDLLAGHDISLGAGRDINIDAGRDTRIQEQEREYESQGVSGSIKHNAGSTKDAISNTGKGEDGVSKGSSTLQTVDAIGQFFTGPTGDGKIGNSKQTSSQQSVEQSNRPSTLDAGNDVKMQAGNDVNIKGSKVQAGRDIDIKGRDINIDVAKGSSSQENNQSQSWGGVHGGTSGGFKVGIGGSHGTASADSQQGTSTPAQLEAGGNIKLDASNDLNIVGSQVKAGRDVELNAGNELNIVAAKNDSQQEQNRHSGGGEVGLTFGSEGVGVYASVNMGKGDLERETQRHQQAYVYAGDQLKFTSGKDTNIKGAQVRGDEVIGRVGGDLNVASAIDTGKVKGKEFDINATVTVGPGAGVSGSVGYGKTTGKTEWVEDQTRITGRDKVDIRTENHTQLDGALIAADNGNLKLDTGTLGFSDIAGKDKEHGYYLNVGGSWKKGSASAEQDPSNGKVTADAGNDEKGPKNQTSWSVSGWEYEKDREQTVRATVGAGDITVRKDAESGQDSTVGLNRDLDKAYEITRDKESRTDLYVTDSSLNDVLNPKETLQKWSDGLLDYDKTALKNFEQAGNALNALVNRYQRMTGRPMDSGAVAVAGRALAENTLESLILAGMSPRDAMVLMGNEDFQTQVLQQLNNLEHVFEQSQDFTRELERKLGALELDTTHVTAERDSVQWTLTYVSTINEYLGAHPDAAEAVTVAIAMLQGPKAVIQMAVSQVIDQTELGKDFNAKVEEAVAKVGKYIAERMEGEGDLDKKEGGDFLIGGGKLITSVIMGAIPGRKGGTHHEGSNGPGSHLDVPDTRKPHEPPAGEGPPKGPASAFTQLSSQARRYLNELEAHTGLKVTAEQRDNLANALREKNYTKLTPKETQKHRREFNKIKDELIGQWETKTGQTWPRYTENVMSKDGTKVVRKAGQPYDAHHIIESGFGGPNEWWNMHPARFPDQHQGGIHGKDSVGREIFTSR